MSDLDPLFPVFLKLRGRRVLLVGGGPVALEKATLLRRAEADVLAVSPSFVDGFGALGVTRERRPFSPADLDSAWLVVSAATPEVNRAVRSAADARRIFVLAVDDTSTANAYGAALVEKGGVTFAISTAGHAPALARLLREGLERVLPDDLAAWTETARKERVRWKEQQVPFSARRGLLFMALRDLYGGAS